MIRERVVYTGTVQGVGFRWTVMRMAATYRVAGFVRNLDDGRVELVVEGQRGEVDAFRGAVESRMGDYIEGLEGEELQATGEFSGFDIVH